MALSLDNVTFTDANISDYDETTKTFIGALPQWSKSIMSGVLVMLFIIGVPGNVLVVTTVFRLKQRTSTDWFILFISLSDLLSLLISCPLYVMIFNSWLWRRIGTSFLCSLHHFVLHVVFISSNLFILAIGLDRFFKTCKPHKQILDSRRAVNSCVILTMVSLLACLPFPFGSYNNHGQCVFGNKRMRSVLYAFLLLIVLAVSVVLLYIYTRIYFVLRGRVRTRPELSGATNGQRGFLTSEYNSMKQTIKLRRRFGQPRKKHASVSIIACVSSDYRLSTRSNIPRSETGNQTNPSTLANNTQESDRCVCSTSPAAATRTDTNGHVTSGQECSLYRNSNGTFARRFEKTTKLVGIITCIFALFTIIPVISVVFLVNSESNDQRAGKIAVFFLLRVYVFNNASNPIFFALLSSRFREKVKKTFTRCNMIC